MHFQKPKGSVSLPEYVAINGQDRVAKQLNLTQGAISKALMSDRQIYICANGGCIEAIEVKPFPARK